MIENKNPVDVFHGSLLDLINNSNISLGEIIGVLEIVKIDMLHQKFHDNENVPKNVKSEIVEQPE